MPRTIIALEWCAIDMEIVAEIVKREDLVRMTYCYLIWVKLLFWKIVVTKCHHLLQQSTAKFIIFKYHPEDVVDLQRCTESCVTTQQQINSIHLQTCETIGNNGHLFSPQTLINRLQENSIRARRPLKGPVLTQRHQHVWKWSQVVFSDESWYMLQHARNGERHTYHCVQDSESYSWVVLWWCRGGITIAQWQTWYYPRQSMPRDTLTKSWLSNWCHWFKAILDP